MRFLVLCSSLQFQTRCKYLSSCTIQFAHIFSSDEKGIWEKDLEKSIKHLRDIGILESSKNLGATDMAKILLDHYQSFFWVDEGKIYSQDGGRDENRNTVTGVKRKRRQSSYIAGNVSPNARWGSMANTLGGHTSQSNITAVNLDVERQASEMRSFQEPPLPPLVSMQQGGEQGFSSTHGSTESQRQSEAPSLAAYSTNPFDYGPPIPARTRELHLDGADPCSHLLMQQNTGSRLESDLPLYDITDFDSVFWSETLRPNPFS